ncbi:hypothetical protein JTE90_006508 [Oedothorax gibbosus]|uniref:Metalloendopeptidase n=1 Tax=Oedothorax gibbosus TaxID=931172 RepID=A0AAV6VMN6_9ARAC|nr:hypothetical protein JTE90_006508 [Oedothorax gibbosus]
MVHVIRSNNMKKTLHCVVFYLCMCQILSSADQSCLKNTIPEYLDNLLATNKLKEFISVLQIPNTDLVDPTQRKAIPGAFFYSGLFGGDIVFRPGQILNDDEDFDFNVPLKLSINKWPNGVVPYYLSKTLGDNQTDLIHKEIKYTNHKLKPYIKFRPYQEGDEDYVLFIRGGSGCFTNLGRVGGPQVISLDDLCFVKYFISHEMQHVLGVAHEHNRSDRNDYIDLKTHNINQALKSQYQIYSSDALVNTGPFDHYSLTNYPVKVPGFDDYYAFELKQAGFNESKKTNMKSLYLHCVVFCVCMCHILSSADQSSSNNTTPEYLENLLATNQLKEFITVLQIPNTDLVNPTQRKVITYELFFYTGLFAGDILYRPGQLLNDGEDFDLNVPLKYSINKWTNGVVPYYISKTFADNQTAFINKEIEYTNQKLAPYINFRPYQDGDEDYVMFFRGGSGCFTNLGRVGGPQVVSLDDPCLIKYFPSHEMQHVLGVGHEHNRNDRNEYIDLKIHNINQVLKSQYEIYSSDALVNTGPYDYYSLMSYPVKVPGFEDYYGFELKKAGFDESKIGIGYYGLTPTDVQRIKTLYG